MLALSGVASASASANTFVFNYTGTGASKNKLSGSIGKVNLESRGGVPGSCESGVVSGEVSGASGSGKLANTLITFSGCKVDGKVCRSTGQAQGVMKSGTLEGELGVVSKGDAGLLLKAKSGAFMACNAGTLVVEFDGGLIGGTTRVNEKLKSLPVRYSQTRGVQGITRFEGGSENALQETLHEGEGWEGAGVEAEITVKTVEGELEIAEVA
jgi:hypothetical protein